MAKVKNKPKKKNTKPVAKHKKRVANKTLAKKILAKAKPVKKIVAKALVKKTVPAVAPKKAASVVNRRPSGIPEQMRDAALKVLDERQAEEIATFDLAGRSSVADYLIVASGRNGRQLAAIAQYLGEAFGKLSQRRVRVEGLPDANWVLVDGGDVIVHLFLPEVRGFYNLEGIWSRKG